VIAAVLQLDAFWHYGFLERALVAGLLMSLTCGILSPFVVLRRLSFSADGLAHASIGGLAVGLLLFETGPTPGLASYAASFVFTCGVGLAIAYFSSEERLHADTAVGACFVAAFALGILMLSLRQSYTAHLEDYLFGSILAVNMLECRLLLGLAVLVAVGCGSCWRWLGAWTFDEELAQASGVPTGWLRYGLLVVIAATVVLSIEVVGALLVMAMLILPGAIGTLSARSMAMILTISIAVAMAATVAGMVVSNVTNVPPGPGIVLSAFLLFVAAFFLQKFRVRHGRARRSIP
jgi:zinc transport system permease protein